MTDRNPGTQKALSSPWAAAIFACTLLLSALFAYALTLPTVPNSRGLPHADYSTMLQGASGVARHGDQLWLVWAIGCAEILLFVSMLALGARRGKGNDLQGMGRPLAVCLAGYLAVWSLLMVAYADYLQDPAPELYLALPAPTAIMLYLLWPMPFAFAALYVFGFRRWVFSPQDEEAFQRLVEKRQNRQSAEAS